MWLLSTLLPDKIVPDERPHGEQAGQGRGLVCEHVHLDGVIAGDLQPGGDAQLQRLVPQEREVSHRADQD